MSLINTDTYSSKPPINTQANISDIRISIAWLRYEYVFIRIHWVMPEWAVRDFYTCFYVFAQKSLLHKTPLDWFTDSLTSINSIHSPINCIFYKAIFDAVVHDILCRLSRYRAFAVRCPVHNWIQWNFQLQSALGICLISYPRIRPTENTKKKTNTENSPKSKLRCYYSFNSGLRQLLSVPGV